MDKRIYDLISSKANHSFLGLRPGSPINPAQLYDLCGEVFYSMSHVAYDDETPSDLAIVTSEIKPIN